MLERLQKYLAHCGIASRRKAEQLITAGLVEVNGKVVKQLGTKVDPAQDQIKFKGKIIAPPRNFVYYLLYKPKGYTATVTDPHAEKVVTELIQEAPKIYPVGRLDKNSEGLLLLTNDGDFAQKVSHPSFGCEKEYQVVIKGKLPPQRITQLERGIKVEGKLTSPCKIEVLASDGHNTKLKIILHEGRKRQIRRMFAYFNYEVLSLKRIRIDNLILGNLKEGEYRQLTKTEVDHFKQKQCSKSAA